MISYLQGKVILKKEKLIILDVQGVGYKVFVSQQTLSKIPEINNNLKLFCFLNVRENNLDLYGFLDFQELEFFEILNGISGVGPKIAAEIASLGPLEKIKEQIVASDGKIFEGIPGIGRKRAMTIMMELAGKIKIVAKKENRATGSEAEEALTNLGFSRQEVKQALESVPAEIQDTEKRIKEALKILGS